MLLLLLFLQTYVIHVRDVIRKVERDYKVTNKSNTVEYLLKGLEPGGRYSVSVRLRNMSKEASFTLSTGTLAALTLSARAGFISFIQPVLNL